MRLELYHYNFDLSNMDEVLQTIDILKKKLYLLEFKKIISFSYKEDLVSRCVYVYNLL